MLRTKILTISLTMMFAGTVWAEKAPAPVLLKVFVTPAMSADGFVDSGRNVDSAKDLREALAKKKGVGIVASEKEADIILEVRGGMAASGQQTNTTVGKGIFGGLTSTSTTKAVALPAVAAHLRVRGADYSKDFETSSQRFWKDLAKIIANETVAWVNTNWAQLQKTLKENPAK